jgi:hypothetical protein
MTRKSRPWAVTLAPAGGADATTTEHTSEAKAYEQVRAETAAVKAGTSTTSRIRVEQWNRLTNRWDLFDLINPRES